MRLLAALPFYLAALWILLLALIMGWNTATYFHGALTEGLHFALNQAVIGIAFTIVPLLAGGGVWALARKIHGQPDRPITTVEAMPEWMKPERKKPTLSDWKPLI